MTLCDDVIACRLTGIKPAQAKTHKPVIILWTSSLTTFSSIILSIFMFAGPNDLSVVNNVVMIMSIVFIGVQKCNRKELEIACKKIPFYIFFIAG